MDQNKYQQISAQAIANAQALRNSQAEWKLLKQGQYLQIFCQKYLNTDSYSFKITGEIPADFKQAQNFYFQNNQDMAKNRENCDAVDIVEVIGKDDLVCLIKMSSPNSTIVREFLIVRNRSHITNDEVLVVNGFLDNHPKAPLSANSERQQMAINAQFVKKISPQSSFLEIYFLRDFSKALLEDHLPLIADSFLKTFEKDVEKIISSNS